MGIGETTEPPSTVTITTAPAPVSSLQASDRLVILVNENGSVSAVPLVSNVFINRILCATSMIYTL